MAPLECTELSNGVQIHFVKSTVRHTEVECAHRRRGALALCAVLQVAPAF